MSSSLNVCVNDDARPSHQPLRIIVKEDGYGVATIVYSHDDVMIGSVVMDYHDNQLKALVYRHGSKDPDQPEFVHLLSENVDADLQLKKDKEHGG